MFDDYFDLINDTTEISKDIVEKLESINELYIEINRKTYDFLAKQYDDRTLFNGHEIKDNYWYAMLSKIIRKTDTKVLEIGPGSGRNLKIFEDLNCDITAVELSSEMCKVAKRRASTSKIINKNILECEFEVKSFDVIFLMAVIHNFPLDDAHILLKKIHNWLKDDGCLLIGTTIHKNENFGFITKDDYKGKVKRYRYQYTKEHLNNLYLIVILN